MQETQQVEEMQSEFISLSEFIPNWTQLVEDGNGNLPSTVTELYGISITRSNMCVVGEAHGNSREYCNCLGDNYCEICDAISHDHIDSPTSTIFGAILNKDQFLQVKKYLYTHMIDNHPDKMRKNVCQQGVLTVMMTLHLVVEKRNEVYVF